MWVDDYVHRGNMHHTLCRNSLQPLCYVSMRHGSIWTWFQVSNSCCLMFSRLIPLILVVVYSCFLFLLFILLLCCCCAARVDLKEKVARLSLSSPSVVRVCVVGMGMGMRYDISVICQPKAKSMVFHDFGSKFNRQLTGLHWNASFILITMVQIPAS